MRRWLLMTLCALWCCAPLAHAMEIDDLRVGYAPLGGRDFESTGDVVISAPKSNFLQQDHVSVTTGAKQHRRSTIAYRRSIGELQAGLGAPIVGVEVADDRVREEQGPIHYDGRTYMLDAVVGWAWRVMPGWHVEQGLIAGIGKSRWHQRFDSFFIDGTDWDDTANGFAYEYGFGVGTYYTVLEHAQVGLDLRHLVTRSRARFIGSHDNGGGNVESASYNSTFDVRGLSLTLSAGYRF